MSEMIDFTTVVDDSEKSFIVTIPMQSVIDFLRSGRLLVWLEAPTLITMGTGIREPRESVVEDAALTWFTELGDDLLHGSDIALEEPGAE